MGRKSRLSQSTWSIIEKRLLSGESGRSLAREYEISESTIRQRFGQVTKIKVNDVAAKIVETRRAVESLPPSLRVQANRLADTLEQISNMSAMSAELSARTAFRMSSLANMQAAKLDDENPDVDIARMVHGFTETSNKAAYQPLELIKANRDLMQPETPPDDIKSGLSHFYGEA